MTIAEPSTQPLRGRVALVTGAASGIGRGSALAFARAGATVVVADVDSEGGEETVALIDEIGGDARFVAVDVTQSSEVEKLVACTIEFYGRLDCAHNNAGMMSSGIPVEEYDEDLWDSIIELNLKGTWLCMKCEIPRMRAQKSGVIVNTASIAGLHGTIGASAYSASKHAVLGLTRSAAQECAADGIRVNAVCPSWIVTPPVETTFSFVPDLEQQLAERTPLGRIGTVDEVANAVVWLCTDAASYITGHALVIDGGMTS